MRRVAGCGLSWRPCWRWGAPAKVRAQESSDHSFKTESPRGQHGRTGSPPGRYELVQHVPHPGQFGLRRAGTGCRSVPEAGPATFTVKINDQIDFRIQPDFSKIDKVGLKDAWGRFTFSKAFRLKGGHFKRPFDEFFIISSTQGLTVERALAIRGIDGLLVPNLTSISVCVRPVGPRYRARGQRIDEQRGVLVLGRRIHRRFRPEVP